VYTVSSNHELLDQLFAVSLAVAEHTNRGLEERELSRAQARLLWALADHGPVTQQQLSRLLQVTPRYVTRLVDGMEDQRLVARQTHPSDRRATIVRLLNSGVQLTEQMRTDHERLAEELFGSFSSSQRCTLLVTLRQLAEALSRT
jgi:DNA-binding MarR family transcriptional regulator